MWRQTHQPAEPASPKDGEIFGELPKISVICPEIFKRRAQVPRLTGATGQIIVATVLPKNPGAGLARAWCGPGAGLVRAWRSLAFSTGCLTK